MFDAYIITTINTFGTDKIKKLTQRAYDTCKANNVNPILFDAITPYTLEEFYPMWEVREDYRERLLGNYRRKAGKEPTKENLETEKFNRLQLDFKNPSSLFSSSSR